jgi:hypothetical protein
LLKLGIRGPWHTPQRPVGLVLIFLTLSQSFSVAMVAMRKRSMISVISASVLCMRISKMLCGS